MSEFLLRWFVLPIVLLAVGTATGWQLKSWKDATAQVDQFKTVVKTVQAQGNVNQAVATTVQKAQDHVIYVNRIIHDQVRVLVPAAADAACVVNRGFVRLYNAAVAGDVSPVSIGAQPTDAAPSGVALSTVAATDNDNLAAANALRAQVIGWQDWYNRQRPAFPSR